MPKSPNVGPKPVDNGRDPVPTQPGLGSAAPVPTTREGGGLGWGITPAGGGGGIGWGSVSPAGVGSQIGLGSMGGLQGLLGALRGPQGTPGLGSINGGGLGASGYAGNDPRMGGVGGPANPMAPPAFEGRGGLGGQSGPAYPPAGPGYPPGSVILPSGEIGYNGDTTFSNNPMPSAARPGFSQGNRGAQKRMGGSSYAPRTAVDTNWDSPGGYSAPASPPPPMPGITSDPGPAGGGLQSLLARARAMSPYGRG